MPEAWGSGQGAKVGQGQKGLGGRMLTKSRWQEASQGWTSKDQACVHLSHLRELQRGWVIDSAFVFYGISFPTTCVMPLTMFVERFLSSEITVERSDDCTHAVITGPSTLVFTSEKTQPIF